MKKNALKELIDELDLLYKDKRKIPFPYAGCQALLQETKGKYDLFVPYLDLYLMEIAGYGCSPKEIVNWTSERIEKAQSDLSLTFFERHPQYAPLQSLITEIKTPDLYQVLAIYERMRLKLLKLLSVLITNRIKQN